MRICITIVLCLILLVQPGCVAVCAGLVAGALVGGAMNNADNAKARQLEYERLRLENERYQKYLQQKNQGY